MAKMTSAEAAKLLRKLNEELSAVMSKEEQGMDFLAALGEDPETVRPEYDYEETDRKIDEIEMKIRLLKHAINEFNVTTVVPVIDMTVDQALVYIPQLNKKCSKLWKMMNKLPKTRESTNGYGRSGPIIDYRYINYDRQKVENDYYKFKSMLDCAQLELDRVNSTYQLTADDIVVR